MNDYQEGHGKAICASDEGRQMLKCPVCKRPLMVDAAGKWKLKTRLVIFLKDKTLAKCKYCRSDIKIPVKFDLKEAFSSYAEGKHLSIDPD
jgi:hypothetical protein